MSEIFANLMRETMLSLPAPLPPVGGTPPPTPLVQLAELKFDHEGCAAATGEMLDAGDFAGVVRTLGETATCARQLNNLGCAYALLAAGAVGASDLWLEAGDALRRSSEAGGDAFKDVADANLKLVVKASGGVVLAS